MTSEHGHNGKERVGNTTKLYTSDVAELGYKCQLIWFYAVLSQRYKDMDLTGDPDKKLTSIHNELRLLNRINVDVNTRADWLAKSRSLGSETEKEDARIALEEKIEQAVEDFYAVCSLDRPQSQEVLPELSEEILDDCVHDLRNAHTSLYTNLSLYIARAQGTAETIKRLTASFRFIHSTTIRTYGLLSKEPQPPQVVPVSLADINDDLENLFAPYIIPLEEGGIDKPTLRTIFINKYHNLQVLVDPSDLLGLFMNMKQNLKRAYDGLDNKFPQRPLGERVLGYKYTFLKIKRSKNKLKVTYEDLGSTLPKKNRSVYLGIVTQDHAGGHPDSIVKSGRYSRGESTHEGGKGIGMAFYQSRLEEEKIYIIIENIYDENGLKIGTKTTVAFPIGKKAPIIGII